MRLKDGMRGISSQRSPFLNEADALGIEAFQLPRLLLDIKAGTNPITSLLATSLPERLVVNELRNALRQRI
jgi:hypothetical protein